MICQVKDKLMHLCTKLTPKFCFSSLSGDVEGVFFYFVHLKWFQDTDEALQYLLKRQNCQYKMFSQHVSKWGVIWFLTQSPQQTGSLPYWSTPYWSLYASLPIFYFKYLGDVIVILMSQQWALQVMYSVVKLCHGFCFLFFFLKTDLRTCWTAVLSIALTNICLHDN